jgi:hypothetical protein
MLLENYRFIGVGLIKKAIAENPLPRTWYGEGRRITAELNLDRKSVV